MILRLMTYCLYHDTTWWKHMSLASLSFFGGGRFVYRGWRSSSLTWWIFLSESFWVWLKDRKFDSVTFRRSANEQKDIKIWEGFCSRSSLSVHKLNTNCKDSSRTESHSLLSNLIWRQSTILLHYLHQSFVDMLCPLADIL